MSPPGEHRPSERCLQYSMSIISSIVLSSARHSRPDLPPFIRLVSKFPSEDASSCCRHERASTSLSLFLLILSSSPFTPHLSSPCAPTGTTPSHRAAACLRAWLTLSAGRLNRPIALFYILLSPVLPTADELAVLSESVLASAAF